jgi:3-oxoacyl-[acyl-carrier protein] reductase
MQLSVEKGQPMPDRREVALVTGGARGIGLGIALKLADAGFTLAISGRRTPEQVQPALEEIRKHGQASIYIQADVSSGTDRSRLLLTIEESLGRLDVLVNNAGIAPRTRADILEAREDSFDELFATNLKGPYFLTQAVAAWMIRQHASDAQGHRAIINIGSVSGTVASVNRGDYCISKAGIAMATRLWAVRLGEFGIGVYEVRPGIIESDMTAGVRDKYDALIETGLLLEKRWGTPADVGAAVALLAKGDLPYATGSVLVVDGGLTVPRL